MRPAALIAALAVACGGGKGSTTTETTTPVAAAASEPVDIDARVKVDGEPAAAALILEDRLELLGLDGRVMPEGDGVDVNLRSVPAPAADLVRDALSRTPSFEIRVVAPVGDLAAALAAEPSAGVSASEETLVSGDPLALARVATRVFVDRDVGLSKDDREGRWIAHPLSRAEGDRMLGPIVEEAFVLTNDRTLRPEVLVTFTAQARAAFADLTTRHTDRKVAIVVDGRVVLAAVVTEPIVTGKIYIDMAGDSNDERYADASALVGSITAAMRSVRFELTSFDVKAQGTGAGPPPPRP